MDKFDYKKYLVENKLGPYSRLKEDEEPVKMDGFYFFDDYNSWKNKMYTSFPETQDEPQNYVKINGNPASEGALDNIDIENDKVKCSKGYVNYGGWDPIPTNKNYRRGYVNAKAGMSASDLVYPKDDQGRIIGRAD